MKLNKKYIYIILSLVVIIILIIFIKRHTTDKVQNKYEFPSTLKVNNNTSYKTADTIILVILNKIYNYDTMVVDIYYYNNQIYFNDYDIIGFIEKNQYNLHHYLIYIKKNLEYFPDKTFFSHELVHLNQMELNKFKKITNNKVIYLNDTIDCSKIPYPNRQFEIDAFNEEKFVYKKLNYYLYQKM